MKIAIIYHSEDGNTRQLAQTIAKGTKINDNIVSKIMSINDINRLFVEEADALIIGSPTYWGNFSWQMKQWLDTTDIKFAGKLGSVFATSNSVGGGTEFAEISIITHLLAKGMLVYSSGCSTDKPYTHFGTVKIASCEEKPDERAILFGQRIAAKAYELFSKY